VKEKTNLAAYDIKGSIAANTEHDSGKLMPASTQGTERR